MDLTVTDSPQAIFPFGEQDSFVIANKGPYTVYADSDSSISVTTSHPIPPTGVMTWDSNRPLWLVSSGNSSQVTIVRNSSPSLFTNALDSLLYELDSNTNVFVTDMLECTAWNTISLIFSSRNFINTPANIGTPNIYLISIRWYAADTLDSIYTDHYELPARSVMNYAGSVGLIGAIEALVHIPVRGSRFEIVVTPFGPDSGEIYDVRVMGSTRPISRPEMLYAPYVSAPHASIDNLELLELGIDSFSLDVGGLAENFPTLWIPPLGRNVTVTIDAAGTSTTAGVYVLRSIRPGLGSPVMVANDVTIPTGTNVHSVASFTIPISTVTQLYWSTTIKQGGGATPLNHCYMKVSWSD